MIKIKYGSVAAGAKEKFDPQLTNCSNISNADDLTENLVAFANYGNPCEAYSVLLDGNSVPIPENTKVANIGVWGGAVCDDKGDFSEYPTVKFISTEYFDISGLTLEFDKVNNAYPTSISVSWYKGSTLKASKDFTLSSPVAVISETVSDFNIMTIVFKKMNTPKSRLKFHSIEYGATFDIFGSNIKNVQVSQEINPISTTVPISTSNAVFLSKSESGYDFEEQQTIEIWANEQIIGKFLIDEATRNTKQQWSVRMQDYIAILDTVDFEGGIYNNATVGDILNSIFNKANVPYTISDSLSSKTVSGHIPYTTCRKALQQVLFAIGAYAKTAYSQTVGIRNIDYEAEPAEEIPMRGRIMIGSQSVTTEAMVSEVELTEHSYSKGAETTTLYTAQNAVEDVLITFTEPVDEDTLTLSEGTISAKGVNYAIVTCGEGATLKGVPYKHTKSAKSKINPKAHARKSNKKSITDATLISSSNIDTILDLCYTYLTRPKTLKSKIVEGTTPFDLGSVYSVETEMWGTLAGVLTQQSFSIYGSKISKDVVIK